MKNLTIVFLMALGLFVNSCDAQSKSTTKVSEGIISVNAQEFKKLLKEKVGVLIDVRTGREFEAGHIEDAKLITVTDASFTKRIESLDKDVPVMVYCRSGARSMKAAQILKSKGFRTIYNLSGGYGAYLRIQ